MGRIEEILLYNEAFVANKDYEPLQTTKFPDKKILILSCMDTRLTQLLPMALNLKNGDAKFIKNAGALLSHPFGSITRSIIVAIYELGVEEILVIGHYGCGMNAINADVLLEKMQARGISMDTLKTLQYAGIDIKKWLKGFDCVVESVNESVEKIRNHPLIPKDILVHGLVIDPETGKLDRLEDISQSEI